VTRLDAVTTSANDLTDNNTVASTTGIISRGANIQVANLESLSRASNASLQTGDVDYTCSAWVNNTTLGVRVIAGKDAAAGAHEWLLFTNAAAFRFSAYKGGTAISATDPGVVSTGVWYFVVAWHDATAQTVNIQVNNGAVTSTSLGGVQDAAGALSFQIGARGGNELPLDAIVDEVGFWKSAAGGGGVLTAAQRTSLYNGGIGLTFPFAGAP
jgi:hypothetical protein